LFTVSGMARRDATLEKIVGVIKRELKPKRLFLFGSRAAGHAKRESDYDFMAIVRKKRGDRMDHWQRVGDLIKDECGVDADVFFYYQQ